eukprot:gene16376-19485_t
MSNIIPTLTYFNNQGKAEISRLIFAYAGVQFNDVRVEEMSDELRAQVPLGVLPYYEDADLKTGQSVTISRYLANKYNISGSNIAERAQADSLIDSIWDLLTAFYFGREDAEKLAGFKTLAIPKFLNYWQSILTSNGGKYFVGQSLTWADLGLFFALQYLTLIGFPDVLPQYPILQSFVESIGSIPNIKQHVDARPVTKL